MKKNILTPILFVAALMHAQTAPSQNQNYVYSKTYLSDPTAANVRTSESVNYYDGLGRPKQELQVKASPLGRDVVTHIVYDNAGRQANDYLPVPQAGTQNGGFYSSPLTNATQADIYGTEKIYAEKTYEQSPLDRVLQQTQVGTAWSTKPIKFQYDANIQADYVRKYETTTTWDPTGKMTVSTIGLSQYFLPSSLYKNTVTDEDGNKTIEFKNGQGQTVLVRKVLNATENADTYYVYDEYNQLAFVVPPASPATPDTTALNKFCYQYRYDGKGRQVEKKLPGKDWEYMVYDKSDRLVLTQDFGLRSSGKWLLTKYDKIGRVVYTGTFTGGSRATLQNQIGSMVFTESRDTTGFVKNGITAYYTNTNLTSSLADLLSVNYYDTYPTGTPTIPTQVLGQDVAPQTAPTGSTVSTRGLQVASYIKNIEDNNWTKTYTFYDKKERVILVHSINHLGGYIKTLSQLDFTGTPLRTETYHKRTTADIEKKILEDFEYDYQNRLLKHTHQVDSNAAVVLAINTYNELSQVANKKVGDNLQSIDYKYNIRGWLSKINDPANLGTKLFAYDIKYNNPTPDTNAIPKYNGNIAEVNWKTGGDTSLRRYTYNYDSFDRLLSATYSKPDVTVPASNAYGESAEYDINGNIKRMVRNGDADANTAINIDDIGYIYDGNRLTSATDATPNPSGLNGGGAITYDNDGRMLTDAAHSMTGAEYNHLNLLKKIKRNADVFSYNYRADGTKVLSTSLVAGQTTNTDYLDGFQYKEGILQFVPTAEGYYDFAKNRYIYQYKDQLQNVRVSYYSKSSLPTIIEINNYYPFGLKHQGYSNYPGNPSYKYGFQKQELQDTGFISFKWRNYMPDLGRFFTTDVLAEDYRYQSPYNFSENAVVNHLELEGLEAIPIGAGGLPILVPSPNYGNPKTGLHPVGTQGNYQMSVTEGFKQAVEKSVNFWGGLASKASEPLIAQITVGVSLTNSVLNSDDDSKGKDKKSGEDGIVYKRKEKAGKEKDYVGQAKSEERYKKRQKEHNRANKDADYEFEILDRGKKGKDLDKKEQKHIDEGGGPTNKSNPNGGLQNKRNQIKPKQEPKIKQPNEL
ncbi:DUF6443 domain-containing protein [Chryseobacterium populi]|uniref:DUF6443 domain-containing protein n=1 Tax=Chryseobacterium populi TaxID=1144316 RepID=J2KMT1_9FLAO|nr:DUF6443 domain-containing protein [Chryseobacterium populi]EJL74398.1 hypothetical protein PMI13_01137 [Chryseobacterium populi]